MVFMGMSQDQRLQTAHVKLLQLGQKPVCPVTVPAVNEEIAGFVPYEHGISLTGRQDVNLQIAVVACMRCTACQTNNKDCHQYPNDTEQSFSLKGIHAAAMPPSPAAAAIQAVAGCLPDGL